MLFEQLNPHACKTYLVGDGTSGDVVLVDPVIDHTSDYLDLLRKRNLRLDAVIDTHTHADHISAGPALRDATDCHYAMHRSAAPKCVTIHLEDGETRHFAGVTFRFLHTPGHTQDSMTVVVDGKLLTGDFLFLDDAGGGRDDLPGGDPGAHWESLRKLEALPDDLMVHPAHEYRERKPSSLGTQRRTNPHLRPRSRAEFVQYLDDLRLGPADWMKDVLKANYACARDPKAAWIPVDSPACEISGTRDKSLEDQTVGMIRPTDLRKRLAANDRPFLLDVREPYELRDVLGHIDGVVNVPIGSLAHSLDRLALQKENEIVVVCRSGARAMTGAQILKKTGFRKVSVLEGGMIGWRRG